MESANILLGVSGSIAAYKACDLVRRLQDQKFTVSVVMTSCAEKFVSRLTFEALTRRPVHVDMFAHDFQWDMAHISLAKWAQCFVIAPATANVIGKIAAGIADDLLTCTALAVKCPVLVAPAMNTDMYSNPVVQKNIASLRAFGYHLIAPREGRLACGDTGPGALAEAESIIGAVKAL